MSRVLPILFNSDMVRAILNGRKTATRRIIKFPVNRYTKEIPIADNIKVYENTLRSEKVSFHEEPHYCLDIKPPYRMGDILYVRETWGWEPCWDCGMDMEEGGCAEESATRVYNQKKREWGCYCYKASMENGEELSVDAWHASIHMPKEAARIWLKVTDVRVERLQDIDDDGVVAEGLQIGDPFDELWDYTIKKKDLHRYGWDANPWVWVIKFEPCEKPNGGKNEA